MVVFLHVGVFCFICSKKLADVRWVELREAMSGPLIELATSKAVQWCYSKPIQIAYHLHQVSRYNHTHTSTAAIDSHQHHRIIDVTK